MGFSQNSTFGFGAKGTDSSGFLTSANEGLSVDGNTVQLGQLLGTLGDPAVITFARQIPFSDDGSLLLSTVALDPDTASISLTPSTLAVVGQSIVDFQRPGTTNRNISLSPGNNIFALDDWAALNIYPSSGTNVASTVNIIPKGTGVLGELFSELWLFGTDFTVDSTNYDAFYIRNSLEEVFFTSEAAGTGTVKPISFNVGSNTGLIDLNTDGTIGISTNITQAKLHITQSTVTGSASTGLINASTSWNTTGAPTAIRFHVSDTASDAASLIVDISNGGGSLLRVDKNGTTISMPRSIGAQAITCFSITPQWTTSGSPTALLVNPTNSASGANATLMDLQISNVSRFKVDKNGIATLTSAIFGAGTPTAILQLAAGTAAANSAPLKFVSGTNLATPEAGAMEFNGTHLYITIGSTRFQLDQQLGTTTVNNGLSFFSSSVRFGQAVGQVGDPALCTASREIPFSGYTLGFIASHNTVDVLTRLSPNGVFLTGNHAASGGVLSQLSLNYDDVDCVYRISYDTTFNGPSIKGSAGVYHQPFLGVHTANEVQGVLQVGWDDNGLFPQILIDSGTLLATAVTGGLEYDAVNLFFTRTGTTRENVLVGNSGATAPSTTPGATIVNYYGTSDTNFLGTPNSWASVNLSGTTYKIPLYT